MERIGLWFLLLVPAVLGDGGCLPGFVPHDSSCYAFPDLNTTWAQAKVYCQAVGGDLATVESKEEQDFVIGQAIKVHGPNKRGGDYWLDGCDYLEEGEWIWASTKQRMVYTDWAPGQPDNDDLQEHCLHLSLDWGRHWNDHHCHENLRFICEHFREDIVIGRK